MSRGFNISKDAADGLAALLGVERYLHRSGLEHSLIDLVNLRVSQINGCAFCIDMHWKDLRAAGETEQRLYSLDAWRECPYYTDREVAALAWAESLTLVRDGHVPDTVYETARQHFNEKDLADLTLAIAMINTWNRLNIAARTDPGTYRPGALREVLHA
jgi:AhpD family alkylhydroperoxidase